MMFGGSESRLALNLQVTKLICLMFLSHRGRKSECGGGDQLVRVWGTLLRVWGRSR